MPESPRNSQKKAGFIFLFFLLTVTASAVANRQTPSKNPGFHTSPVRIPAAKRQTRADYRRLALGKFFQKHGCPAAKWSDVFIREADRNELDWRLVASIAMIESTGGKHYKNRNILGWKSALQRFQSEPAGIVYVSSRLHVSPLYRGKSLPQLLKTYNSERRNYSALISTVMTQLAAMKAELEGQGEPQAYRQAS